MAVFEYIGGGGGSSDVVGYPAGTKMYLALLTQSGTDAPVATVLVNTLGGTVVWSRNTLGDYRGTLSGAFTENKTVALISNGSTGGLNTVTAFRSTANYVSVYSFNTADGQYDDILANATIQILVFP